MIKCPICNEFFCETHSPNDIDGFWWIDDTLQVYIYGLSLPIPLQYQFLFWDWYTEGMNIKQ
jgi:hypothetical protein